MKNEIVNKIGGTISRAGFGLKKHSPEILVVAGVIGTVASAVLACKATTKISEILDDHKEQMDLIHETAKNEALDENEYSEEDAKKDTSIVYVQTGLKLAKLYAPAVALGVVSLGSIIASNSILRKRNAAIAAAYAAVDRGFKEYRARVIERFGEEVDHQLKYNLKAQEIEETVKDEKGKAKKVKKTIEIADPDSAASPYMKYFAKSNPYWENDSDYAEMFIRSIQNYANDLLRATGHVTLNKVYEMLGMNETKAGMVVGWMYDPQNPTGDNYIEFDVKRVHIKSEGEGFEEAYAIDFNVDGNIYNEMK